VRVQYCSADGGAVAVGQPVEGGLRHGSVPTLLDHEAALMDEARGGVSERRARRLSDRSLTAL
jgi:hypothetical protein